MHYRKQVVILACPDTLIGSTAIQCPIGSSAYGITVTPRLGQLRTCGTDQGYCIAAFESQRSFEDITRIHLLLFTSKSPDTDLVSARPQRDFFTGFRVAIRSRFVPRVAERALPRLDNTAHIDLVYY